MYTLRTVKKSERMNHFNVSLGENYHLVDRHNETYYQLRERHFSGMGFSSEQMAKYNNPFVVGNNFANPIYLENGFEYYVMTESGKTFENLSGLVNHKEPKKEKLSSRVFYEMGKHSQLVIDTIEELEELDSEDSEATGCLSYDINNILEIIDKKRVDDIKVLEEALGLLKSYIE